MSAANTLLEPLGSGTLPSEHLLTCSPPYEVPAGKVWLVCATCGEWFLRKASEHKKCLARGRTGSYCSKTCTYANALRSAPEGTTVGAKIPDLNLRRTYAETYRSARKNAVKRKIDFNLSVAEFDEIIEQANGCCAVTGLPFRYTKTKTKNARHPFMPSLDRIDSNDSYHAKNVRLVLIAVNNALGTWGLIPFDQIVIARYEKLTREASLAGRV